MEVIKVFYSTTEEEPIAKYRRHFDSQCKQIERLLDVKLDIAYWKDMAGGLGKTAQEVIDRRTVGKYDIYFGVMGTKFGRGTEHEYRIAVEQFIKNGRPIFVSFGFCDAPVDPYTIDLKSFAKLKKFQTDLGTGKTYKRANLYFKFRDKTTFANAVNNNLKEAVSLIKGRVAGGARFK